MALRQGLLATAPFFPSLYGAASIAHGAGAAFLAG